MKLVGFKDELGLENHFGGGPSLVIGYRCPLTFLKLEPIAILKESSLRLESLFLVFSEIADEASRF